MGCKVTVCAGVGNGISNHTGRSCRHNSLGLHVPGLWHRGVLLGERDTLCVRFLDYHLFFKTLNTTCKIIFSWLFSSDGSQWFAPKRFVTPHQTPPRSKILPKDNNGNVLNRPWYYFDWIRGLWMLSEEEILQYGGYDVVMFLRTVQMFFWVFAYFSPYAFFVILPLNLSCRATGDGDGGREFYRTTVTNCLSLASASEGGDRYKSLLFAHYIGLVLLQVGILGSRLWFQPAIDATLRARHSTSLSNNYSA